MNKKTIAAGAAAAAIAGTIALGGVASAADCPAGQEMTQFGCGVVKDYPSDEIGSTESGPAPGTGGLIFRDKDGRDLGSGMGENDRFEWNGKKAVTADGTKLIYVKQVTHGHGGWGSLYSGWVRQKFTQIPSMFD